MLARKYILIPLSALVFVSSGCTLSTKPIAGYAPTSPQLSWQQPAQFSQVVKAPLMKQRRSPSAFVAYLTRLIGQTCSAEKWREITIKAMRSNSVGTEILSVRSGSEHIAFDHIDIGDIAFFHSVKNVPQYAVLSGRSSDGSFDAITVIDNMIRRVRLHPQRPHQRRFGGRIINSFLRTKSPSDRQHGYLAGELLHELRRPIFLL